MQNEKQTKLYSLLEIINENHEFWKSEKIYEIINLNNNKFGEQINDEEGQTSKDRI